MDDRGAAYWKDIDAAFAEASDLDAAGRAHLLGLRFPDAPEMRAEVASLLDAHDRAAHFLIGGPQAPAPWDVPAPEPGTVLGDYLLAERIGEGGMGQVFRAARADGSFDHQVAVKVTRGVVSSGEPVRRFRAERQILASLHHPHIVSLLDGGVAESGHAYLVMELVDGTPITAYCTDRRLDLEARIDLFRQVCSAVHYAHRHGVVHRDLKPANVLVTGDGVAKVLDFGIAKLLSPPDDLSWHTTDLQPAPLTPNYASPEQLRRLPVTTASDVYSLGVMLYEIVAGVRPYNTEGQSLDRMLDIVVRQDPTRPSAMAGGATLPYQPRRLTGDLDAIVLHALAKDVERRYASADELSEDLRRFLSGRPVVAREPSPLYLLRRVTGRNRIAVGVAAVATAAILVALAVALVQWRRADEQRLRAERRFSEVRQLAKALIFKIHDGVAPLPGSTPVRREIVAEAVKYLDGLRPEATDDPTLALELATGHRRIGQVLGDVSSPNLGDREGALRHLSIARGMLERLAATPPVHPDVLHELILVNRVSSMTLGILGRQRESMAAAAQALDAAERLVRQQPNDRKRRETLAAAQFAVAVQQRGRESVPAWQRTLASYEALLAERPSDGNSMRNVALALKYLATAHDGEGDMDRPEALNRRALVLDERRLALEPDSRQAQFDVAMDLLGVAATLDERGDHHGAIPLIERSIELRAALTVSDPNDVLARGRLAVAQRRLAVARTAIGEWESAERLLAAAEIGFAAVSRVRKEPWLAREQAGLLSSRAHLAAVRRAPRSRTCLLLAQAGAAWDDAARRGPLSSKEVTSRADTIDRLQSCAPAPGRAAAGLHGGPGSTGPPKR